MGEGLRRVSAVAWGFVGVYVFWLLAGICFSSTQSTGDNLQGAVVVAVAVAIVYGLLDSADL